MKPIVLVDVEIQGGPMRCAETGESCFHAFDGHFRCIGECTWQSKMVGKFFSSCEFAEDASSGCEFMEGAKP